MTFGPRAEERLNERVRQFNTRQPAYRHADMDSVRTVYRRGAVSASGPVSRDAVGTARVDAYLHLLRYGKPSNPKYTVDNDLLPVTHELSTAGEQALVASAIVTELAMPTLPENNRTNREQTILALTEYMGLGYEAEAAVRASWMRAVRDGEDPFSRATELAIRKYDSRDSDLLPRARV